MAEADADPKSARRVGDLYFGTKAPGVYLQEEYGLPHRTPFETGVPAFLGVVPPATRSGKACQMGAPVMLSLGSQFAPYVGTPTRDSYLAYAVRGFFQNQGQRCYVVPLADNSYNTLYAGLEAIAGIDTIDLVCAPDVVRDRAAAFELQQLVVNHCERTGNRFAILDSRRGDDKDQVWEQWSEIDGHNGALYYPWVEVSGISGGRELVPPCGHIAGIYARTDQQRGVHKAPANEVLNGVLGLERLLTNADQDQLNPNRVNCLRAFPGRGIRVWGARTLSGQRDWSYVNIRRVFLTAVRWIEWNMWDVVFEPNNPSLWARVERELYTYFNAQFRAGALKGGTPQEAFYIKCDAETNPPELRESGQLGVEIGLAPTVPYEFVVVRLIHGEKGITISGPERPERIY